MIEFENKHYTIAREGDNYLLELKHKNEGDWYAPCYALNTYLVGKGVLNRQQTMGPPNASGYYGARPRGIQKAVFPPNS